MQHPVGFIINDATGRAELTSIFSVLTNSTASPWLFFVMWRSASFPCADCRNCLRLAASVKRSAAPRQKNYANAPPIVLKNYCDNKKALVCARSRSNQQSPCSLAITAA